MYKSKIQRLFVNRDHISIEYTDGSSFLVSIKEAAENIKKDGQNRIYVKTDYDHERDNFKYYLIQIKRIAKDAEYDSDYVVLKWVQNDDDIRPIYWSVIEGELYKID